MEISIESYIMICETVLYEVKLKQRRIKEKKINEGQNIYNENTLILSSK
jgi:hypothetical protein